MGGALTACKKSAPAPNQTGAQTTANPDGAEADIPKSQVRRFTHDAGKVSIAYPEDWDVKLDTPPFNIIGLSPAEGGEDLFLDNVSVRIGVVGPDADAQKVANIEMRALARDADGFRRKGLSAETIDGTQAIRLDYEVDIIDELFERRIRCVLFIMVENELAYAVTCSAFAPDYDRYRGAMLDIARSIRFEE